MSDTFTTAGFVALPPFPVKIPPAELNLVTSFSSDLTREDIFPRLPKISYGGNEWTGGDPDDFPYGVSEHSFAVGDINGDGLDDLFFPN